MKKVEKFSLRLLNRRDQVYGKAVLYMVYQVIKHNPGITLNRLKAWFLNDYFIPTSYVEGAVGTLHSKDFFGALTKWQRNNKAGTKEGIHLHALSPVPGTFEEWLTSIVNEYPEFSAFNPTQESKSR